MAGILVVQIKLNHRHQVIMFYAITDYFGFFGMGGGV
jgi:hypothetical protein